MGKEMEFRFLTDKFFDDYKNCPEMERKTNRPYALMCVINRTVSILQFR